MRNFDETRERVCPQAKDDLYGRIPAGPIRQLSAAQQYGGSQRTDNHDHIPPAQRDIGHLLQHPVCSERGDGSVCVDHYQRECTGLGHDLDRSADRSTNGNEYLHHYRTGN